MLTTQEKYHNHSHSLPSLQPSFNRFLALSSLKMPHPLLPLLFVGCKFLSLHSRHVYFFWHAHLYLMQVPLAVSQACLFQWVSQWMSSFLACDLLLAFQKELFASHLKC